MSGLASCVRDCSEAGTSRTTYPIYFTKTQLHELAKHKQLCLLQHSANHTSRTPPVATFSQTGSQSSPIAWALHAASCSDLPCEPPVTSALRAYRVLAAFVPDKYASLRERYARVYRRGFQDTISLVGNDARQDISAGHLVLSTLQQTLGTESCCSVSLRNTCSVNGTSGRTSHTGGSYDPGEIVLLCLFLHPHHL